MQWEQPQFPVTCSAEDPSIYTGKNNSQHRCHRLSADFTSFCPTAFDAFTNISCPFHSCPDWGLGTGTSSQPKPLQLLKCKMSA